MADQPAHRILLLDDDEGLLALCRRTLTRAGHAVVAAGTPAEAEALLSAEADGHAKRVSLIVMDYQLGGPVTGLDFFRALAARGLAPPAVLVTGFSDEGRVLEALRAGVRDVVRKTEDFLERLPVAVDRVLREVDAEEKAREADALRESELRLRLALETGQMGAWEYDFGAGVLRCTDICKAHYELPAAAAPTFDDVLNAVHRDDRDRVRMTFRRAAAARG
ncbi:MAG: multi-sensor hybrid histidine kinase, partial [Phycisphaerales bacterium]|nr:multi-sensor hybrid histidine kinase [Phycisphaerales bacterium]